MNQSRAEIEIVLQQNCEQQTATYAQALELADNLRAGWRPGNDVGGPLQQIGALMEQVARRNAETEMVRQRWLQSGQKPGPPLAAALQTMTTAIERLTQRICELEQLASECKMLLLPEMDKLQRARLMRRAYATAAGRNQAV